MIASYRDPRYAASIRIEQLRERSPWRADDVPAELIQIHARRVARSWAGAVAIVGFFAVCFTSLRQGMGNWWMPSDVRIEPRPTGVLLASVALSVVTYAVSRFTAAHLFERRIRASFDRSSDELARCARLEANGLRRAAIAVAGRNERASIALSMAGFALLAPLSAHYAVWALFRLSNGSAPAMRDFDVWIHMSLLLVGIAHVVLAGLCVWFASKVARSPLELLGEKSPVSGWAALGWTVLAACVPGAIAFLVPPVFVLATGAAFVPALFGFAYRRALRERHALAGE
jgi:hypothetical protein